MRLGFLLLLRYSIFDCLFLISTGVGRFHILLRRTSELLIKNSVKGSQGIESAFEGTVSKLVLFFVHEKKCIFQPDCGKILIEAHVEAGLEIPRQIALVVSKLNRSGF